MEITLSKTLPSYPSFVEGIRRAPDRGYTLTPAQTATALKNALRYIPKELHETLAPEFMEELRTRGRIYGYRYRPQGDLKAKPIDEYKGNCIEGKAFQVMIDNNLCFDIALYPYELVTYGETGQVCQNWMQYRLIKQYLEVLTREQTLVIESGHPLGLFKSKPEAPRVIITNALMVGLYDNQKDWHTAMQMGVANYGQMTAGGWMYIGPQGIVHGTFNTLLNAGRLKLGIPQDGDLRGRLFVSSGLGGMSGAQPKAAEMAGGGGNHCRGGCFPHRNPPYPGLGGTRYRFSGRSLLTGSTSYGRVSPGFCGLSRQCRRFAGICGAEAVAHRFTFRPDFLPCHL